MSGSSTRDKPLQAQATSISVLSLFFVTHTWMDVEGMRRVREREKFRLLNFSRPVSSDTSRDVRGRRCAGADLIKRQGSIN